MIDLDRAVLPFGIVSVIAVAAFNHVHAYAARSLVAPPAVSSASRAATDLDAIGASVRNGLR